MTDAQAQNNQQEQQQFQIHKIYVKQSSFEIPEGIKIFQEEWKPELNVELRTESKALSEKDTYDVTLVVECTVKCGEQTAFVAEVHQAGIFTVSDLEQNELDHILGAFCPNLLYPYLREAISDIVMKGGFPQLALAPINFDMLYEEQKKQKENEKDTVTVQ